MSIHISVHMSSTHFFNIHLSVSIPVHAHVLFLHISVSDTFFLSDTFLFAAHFCTHGCRVFCAHAAARFCTHVITHVYMYVHVHMYSCPHVHISARRATAASPHLNAHAAYTRSRTCIHEHTQKYVLDWGTPVLEQTFSSMSMPTSSRYKSTAR